MFTHALSKARAGHRADAQMGSSRQWGQARAGAHRIKAIHGDWLGGQGAIVQMSERVSAWVGDILKLELNIRELLVPTGATHVWGAWSKQVDNAKRSLNEPVIRSLDAIPPGPPSEVLCLVGDDQVDHLIAASHALPRELFAHRVSSHVSNVNLMRRVLGQIIVTLMTISTALATLTAKVAVDDGRIIELKVHKGASWNAQHRR